MLVLRGLQIDYLTKINQVYKFLLVNNMLLVTFVA